MFDINDFMVASKECASLEEIRRNNGVDSGSFYVIWKRMPSEKKTIISSNLEKNRIQKLEVIEANHYELMMEKLKDYSIYSVDLLARSLNVSSQTIHNWLKTMDSISSENVKGVLHSNYARHKNAFDLKRKKILLSLSKKSINWNELACKFGKSSVTVQKYARDLSITSKIEQNFKEESDRRFSQLINSFLTASKKFSSYSELANSLHLSSFYYYFNKLPENVQEEVKFNIKRNQKN